MIEVSVREHNVPDLLALQVRTGERKATCVDGDLIVNDHSKKMLAGRRPAILLDSTWQ